MIEGIFIDNTPFVKIVLGWGQSVQPHFTILDTGFTGDLQVTPKTAKELGLEVVGVTRTQIADGSVIEIPVALALVSMEGVANSVEVLISDSMPLAGISLLSKFSYKAIVDCKHKTVELERVE